MLADGGVPECVEHRLPVEQPVRVIATGESFDGIAAPGAQHKAVGDGRNASEILGASMSDDVLDDATHPKARRGLDETKERLDRSFGGRGTFRPSAPGPCSEEQARSDIISSDEGNSQRMGELRSEGGLAASRLAGDQDNSCSSLRHSGLAHLQKTGASCESARRLPPVGGPVSEPGPGLEPRPFLVAAPLTDLTSTGRVPIPTFLRDDRAMGEGTYGVRGVASVDAPLSEPDYDTSLWGLRFVDPTVEADYREWHIDVARYSSRLGLVASSTSSPMTSGATR